MEIQKIPLSSVYPSPMNPRKTFDEEALKELADNIEKQGLLQPITVRPHRHPMADTNPAEYPTKYEIVCGERRYRATKMLSEKWSAMDAVAPSGNSFDRFSSISAIVREMTDEEAFDAMITENLQRKDVDPMEEAYAFALLMKKGDSPEEIATRFGKSIRFVQDRCKLNNLIPELHLAVKDGKMPIVAAMIIAKLDDDKQRRYYESYNERYTKSTAEGFVHSMFMTIWHSLWHEHKNADFAGGCGRTCADCPLNTANHGCLFHEMKTDDAGRCTDRNKFHEKTIAFILSELDKHADVLLREGETMEQGKVAICVDGQSTTGEAKEVFNRLAAQIKERGYAISDVNNLFKSRCWYNADDDRTTEFLKNGEVHPVFMIARYSQVMFKSEFWYAKGVDEPTQSGRPIKVDELLSKFKSETKGGDFSISKKCVTSLNAAIKPTGPLTVQERALSLAGKIHYSGEILKKVGLFETVYPPLRVIVEKFLEHPELIDQIEREYIASEMCRTDGLCHAATPFLDDIGAQWCPDTYNDAKAKAEKAHHSKLAKLEKELKELGYDTEGNKLPATTTIPNYLADYERMKAENKDAILLFRIGDFYELYKEDAEVASKVLGLTLTTTQRDGVEATLCGFPHQALKDYLPKLIQSGKRVAVCENLKD